VTVFIGVWMALAGALALLVGVSARRRVRRLKRDGVKAWAEAIHRPLPDGEEHEGRPGQKVLIWYDPNDPVEVVVYGREGRVWDLAFVVVGLIFLAAGAAIAIGN
jgi:Protein of unknown function (DUF3592)